jgi:uncharacterized membrane protein YciS (DUF1049 family)
VVLAALAFVVALAVVCLALVVTADFVVFAFDVTLAAADFFMAAFVLATVFAVGFFLVVVISILSFVFKPHPIKNPPHPSQGRRGLRGTTLLAPRARDAAC